MAARCCIGSIGVIERVVTAVTLAEEDKGGPVSIVEIRASVHPKLRFSSGRLYWGLSCGVKRGELVRVAKGTYKTVDLDAA